MESGQRYRLERQLGTSILSGGRARTGPYDMHDRMYRAAVRACSCSSRRFSMSATTLARPAYTAYANGCTSPLPLWLAMTSFYILRNYIHSCLGSLAHPPPNSQGLRYSENRKMRTIDFGQFGHCFTFFSSASFYIRLAATQSRQIKKMRANCPFYSLCYPR